MANSDPFAPDAVFVPLPAPMSDAERVLALRHVARHSTGRNDLVLMADYLGLREECTTALVNGVV